MSEELGQIAADIQESPQRTSSNVGKSRKGSVGRKVALNAGDAKQRRAPKETVSLTPTQNDVARKALPTKKSASVGKQVQAILNPPEKKAEYGPSSAMDELNAFVESQGETETEPTEAPAAQPAKKESTDFPPYLVDALSERGFSQDDFKTPAAAHKFLLAAQSATRFAPNPAQQERPQQEKAFDPFDGFDRDSFETEFGDHGKKLLGVIENINKRYSDHIGRLAQHAVSTQQAMEAQHRDSVDNAFQSLNGEFKNAFGDGSISDLPQHSLEASNRQSVYNMARVLEQDLMQQGRTPPNFRTLLKRAATTVMGTRAAAPVEETTEEEPPKRRPKVAGGITTNGHETLSPKAGGLNAIRQFMRR